MSDIEAVTFYIKQHFSDKDINITTVDNELGQHVAQKPLFAHKSCEIKVGFNSTASIKKYRRNVRWDFGDGTVVIGITATHTYTLPGKYTIKCTFYNSLREAFENPYTVTVYVKEVIPSQISLYGGFKSSAINTVRQSASGKLCTLLCSLSNTVISEPKISARRVFENDLEREDEYNDIKHKNFYHLYQYYTFLEETDDFNFDNDKQWDKILKPVTEYTPIYIPVYGKFSHNNNSLSWTFYSYGTPLPEMKNIKICNPNSNITLDYRTNTSGYYSTYPINWKSNREDIPDDCTECGKIAVVNIWYKTDKTLDNDLYFFYNENDLKFVNDLISDTNYINIPPLGFKQKTTKITSKDLGTRVKPALTLNGFANYCFENKPEISDNGQNYNKVELYLEHNFYVNYPVNAILAYYIKNDEVNPGKATYNMFKADHIGDNELKLNLYVNDKAIPYNKTENSYYKRCTITPTKQFKLSLNEGNTRTIIYESENVKSLDDIKLPSEKVYDQNVDELIECYTPHPMFINATNLKGVLKAIFEEKDLLKRIVTKGYNFIDDNVNYKTCYIDKFLAILEEIGDNITKYENASFSEINELHDLCRILSMNYSILFGNTYNNIIDISIGSTTFGKNVSDRLLANDVIYCNANGEIIGIKRNGVIMKLKVPSPGIIAHEDYSGDTKIVSFEKVKPTSIDLFETQSDTWRADNKEFIDSAKSTFSFNDYNEEWRWNLSLPDDIDYRRDKGEVINQFYTFYLFNPNTSLLRMYNFLDEKSIPVDSNGNQISVEDWNKDYGFTYDCLMKVLTDKLMLRNNN